MDRRISPLRKSEIEELELAIGRAKADGTSVVKLDISVAERILETMRKPT